MNKIAWACAIAVVCCGVRAEAAEGEGQGKDLTEQRPYTLSEVVVTAGLIPSAALETVREVGRGEIEVLNPRSAADAIQWLPSLSLSRNSKGEETFRLRGFGQRQVSVFLDGVPISVPFDGIVDLSQFVGDNVDRIQVSRGLPSVLYGANALGGTLNILTTPPGETVSGAARLEGSDQGRIFSSLNLQGGVLGLRLGGWGAFDKAPDFRLPDGFDPMPNEDGGDRDHSRFERRGGGLKVLLPIEPDHRIALHVNYLDNTYDIPPNASVAKPRYWRFPEWRRAVVSLNTEHALGPRWGLRSVWFYDRYFNELKSYDDATYSSQTRPYAFDSTYDDESLGILLYPEARLLSAGSTKALFSWKRDVHREKDDEGPWERYAMETYSLGVEQEVELAEGLLAVAGIDGNYLNPTDAEGIPVRDPILLANGQAVLQFHLAGPVSLHCAFGKKSRFPTLKELYSERLGRNIANPDLKAEHAWNVEAGVSLTGKQQRLAVTFFHNRLRDLIVNRQLGQNVQQLQNIGEARIQGFEVEWTGAWRRVSWSAGYTLLNAEDRSEDRESKFLEYRPKHQVTAVAALRILDPLRIQGEMTYTAGQVYRNPDTLAWEPLNDFFVLNLGAEYALLENLSVYLRVENAADHSYVSEYGVPMPGRELSGGVRARF
jgi:iron complex outermembrane receptor protein